jgi:hypothetical protein
MAAALCAQCKMESFNREEKRERKEKVVRVIRKFQCKEDGGGGRAIV